MPTKSHLLAVLAVLALALAMTACGGDSDDEASSAANSGTTANNETQAGSESSGQGEANGGGGAGEGAQGGREGGGGAVTAEKAAFVKKADAICAQSGREVKAEMISFFGSDGIDAATPEENEEAIKQVFAPGVEAQLEELRALDLPAGDEEELEALFDTMEGEFDEILDEPDEVYAEGNPYAESERLARAYGLKVCGGYL